MDARAWIRLHRRVREWRRRLEQRCGIPAAAELRPGDLPATVTTAAPSCSCACHGQPAPPHDGDVAAQGLHIVEDFAVEVGGVQAINVCLDMDDVPACRRVALDRLFNRVNATAAHDGDYALVIFGKEADDMAVGAYERLRSYNPVPVRAGACGDGWQTRNLPIEQVIGGSFFRNPETDYLLPVAGLVAQALLWREEPDAGRNLDGFTGVFTVLDRRASRNDPREWPESEQGKEGRGAKGTGQTFEFVRPVGLFFLMYGIQLFPVASPSSGPSTSSSSRWSNPMPAARVNRETRWPEPGADPAFQRRTVRELTLS